MTTARLTGPQRNALAYFATPAGQRPVTRPSKITTRSLIERGFLYRATIHGRGWRIALTDAGRTALDAS